MNPRVPQLFVDVQQNLAQIPDPEIISENINVSPDNLISSVICGRDEKINSDS